MSRPKALPVGPTRRAESSTSIPPPEPRSSTTSPGCSSASAVGLPQPSDASTAASGSDAASVASYRSEVIGSGPHASDVPQPHPAFWPCAARRAAAPYCCRTVFLMLSLVISMLRSCYIRFCECIAPCYICQREYMKRHATKTAPAIDTLEALFKALADRTRLRILAL